MMDAEAETPSALSITSISYAVGVATGCVVLFPWFEGFAIFLAMAGAILYAPHLLLVWAIDRITGQKNIFVAIYAASAVQIIPFVASLYTGGKLWAAATFSGGNFVLFYFPLLVGLGGSACAYLLHLHQQREP